MSPHTPETIAPHEPAPTGPAAPPGPAPLTPQDLVPHLRDLARSLRERAADHRSS
ncbi:hypothetical protein [Nocardiopsis sp. CC223A]|uniref:hypothetical protein n=1 Tax=Nocardiopsis sp. CC223A TaxID=3044051 RepID=UPI00278C0007|nr:hypothetical protein [Nocardiopsis sp. CC223A]